MADEILKGMLIACTVERFRQLARDVVIKEKDDIQDRPNFPIIVFYMYR